MGTISEKLNYLNDTRLKIKDSLNKFGAELTENDTFRSYSNVLNDIYGKLPKVSGNGSNFTLENVQNGKLDLFEMEGNTIQGRLPSGYTQVDYIESSGEQYIDTGVNPTNTTNIETKVKISDITQNRNYVCGCYSANTFNRFQISFVGDITNYNFMWCRGTQVTRTLLTLDVNNIYEIKTNGDNLTINNQQVIASGTFDTHSKSIYLFGNNSNGTVNVLANGEKMYYFKIYDNNVLVRDFIPCYRNSDNEVGLYDLVNDIFYTNQGTGVFTYGALAPTPDSPIEIEVVENKQVVNVRSNQLLDYTNTYSISNETYIFENDVLTLNHTPNTTYAFLNYRITDVIKNNPGKEVKFGYESIDLSNFNSPNNTIVQLRINKGSTDEYIRLLYKNLTQETYVIPNDTSDIVYANLGIFTNNSSTSLSSSKLVITKPLLYFDNNNEYSKYHNKDYEIDLHSKNLFDKDNINGISGYLYNNKIYLRTTSSDRTFIINCKPNTTYTISRSILTNTFRVAYTDNEIPQETSTEVTVDCYGQINNNNGNDITITTNYSAKYLLVHYGATKDTNLQESLDSIQIDENSTATEYEKFYDYKLCKIEDYKDKIYKENDKWYLHKEIGKHTINENDDVKTGSPSTDGYARCGWGLSSEIMTADFTKVMVVCDKFIGVPQNDNTSSATGKMWYCSVSNTEQYKIMFRAGDNTITRADFSTFIKNNNVTVYYVLKTPTNTEITNETLISQLEAIETETGTNIFEVSNENNVLPSLNVKRLKELEKLN